MHRTTSDDVRPRTIGQHSLTQMLGALALSTAFASMGGAQQAPAPQAPTIFVQGRGEVQMTPDRARVQVGMETQARTSQQAAQENNRKQTAILAAIQRLGVPAANIQTLNYNVSPVQRYDDKLKRVVIDGYQVSNIVQVETDKLEQAGQIIDAGLANGANRVAGLDFLVKERAKGQDSALTLAVASARRQAEVAAKAAGGEIVELLELTINEFERPEPRAMMAMKVEMADTAPTPISAGMNTISVSVGTRWRFARRP
ncbi:MAG: SIMPL domain-containing protein [Gemmatimonas sp.]|uniref:SIMPL domain-containing protein n=1 Tax=Gemmatimonas sp. TaxID=1962908 RepID=UPI0031BEA088|nr:SIMPL domain-containing protein [Gemmatimonas sp.]